MVVFDWKTRWGYLILPSLALFSCMTNLINIIVFLNPKIKDISFKYFLATSIADLFFSIYSFVYICPDCPLHNTYFTQLVVIYSSNYLTNDLAIFCILISIYLSLLRYSILKNRTYLQSLNFYLVISCLFLMYLVYYLSVLFFSKIIPIQQNINNTTVIIENDDYIGYKLVKTSLGESLYGLVTPIILAVIRLILAIFIETSINTMNMIEFRKRFKSNSKSRIKIS
jgi:hypothetical protein